MRTRARFRSADTARGSGGRTRAPFRYAGADAAGDAISQEGKRRPDGGVLRSDRSPDPGGRTLRKRKRRLEGGAWFRTGNRKPEAGSRKPEAGSTAYASRSSGT